MEQSGLVSTEIKSNTKVKHMQKNRQKIVAASEEDPNLHFHCFEPYAECQGTKI